MDDPIERMENDLMACEAERDALAAEVAELKAAIGDPDSYDIEMTPEARAGWILAMNRIADAADPDNRSTP